MTIETKYNIGDKVKFRNPVKYLSDVLIGTITEISIKDNQFGTFIIYTIDGVKTIDGRRTSNDSKLIEECFICGIKE